MTDSRNYLLFTAFLILIMTYNSSAQEKKSFNSYWDNGFHLEDDSGEFDMKFGGRIMYDWAVFDQSNEINNIVGEKEIGTEFRRARFFSSGTIYKKFYYKLQFDYAGGEAVFKDVYFEINDLPFGDLWIGHLKEPFSIEDLTSSKYINLMERAYVAELTPTRNNSFGDNENTNNDAIFIGRISGLPIKNEKGDRLLHIGGAYRHHFPGDRTFTSNFAPPVHMTSDYFSSNIIPDVNYVLYFGGEIAYIEGPFSLQGEFVRSNVNSEFDITGNETAYYAQVSYFLTGESRNYGGSYAGFKRVTPKNNFDAKKNWGAVELALRYSSAEYAFKNNINGTDNSNTINDISAGINWHLNPSTRFMFNYVYTDLEDVGNSVVYQMRLQVDF
ncbi:MAG: OprO/OprP family phosphate-selective porin [Flavobacteriales bacterium]